MIQTTVIKTTMKTPQRLTRPQASAYLGVKTGTLANWAMTKRYNLPFLKIGSRVTYLQKDLDAFIKKQTRGITPKLVAT